MPSIIMSLKNYDLGERIQALILLIIKWKSAKVAEYTGISESQVNRILKKAKDRGF